MKSSRWRIAVLLLMAALCMIGPCFADGAESAAVLWVGQDEVARNLADRQARRASFESISQFGFTGICLEAQSRNGFRNFAESEGARLLAEVIRDARRAHLSVWLAWKPTASTPGASPGLLQVIAGPGSTSDTLQLVRSGSHPNGDAAKLSPVHETVRVQFANEAAVLAALEPDGILMVDFGFEDIRADVSPAAERAFAFQTRRSLRRWPEDVLLPNPPPQLIADWQLWRALVLRDSVLDIRAAIQSHRGRRVSLILLTSGPYSEAADRGLNWATAESIRLNSNVRESRFGETACGHLFDAVVVGTWLPAQTEAEAVSQGFRPEFAAARIMGDAPLSGVPRWSLLDAAELDAPEFTARLKSRQVLGSGVLVLDYRACEDFFVRR